MADNPFISDADAASLVKGLSIATPEQKPRILDTLEIYKVQKQKQEQEQEMQFKRTFMDPVGYGLSPEQKMQLDTTLAKSPDPKGDTLRLMNEQFLASRYKKPVEEVGRNYAAMRDVYAKDVFGMDVADDATFFNRVGEDYRLDDELSQKAIQAAAKDLPPLAAWAESAASVQKSEAWNKSDSSVHLDKFSRVFSAVANELAPYRDDVAEMEKRLKLAESAQARKGDAPGSIEVLFSDMSPDAISELGAGKDAMKEAINMLLDIPADKRPLVMMALASKGKSAENDELAALQRLGRFFERGVDGLIVEGSTGVVNMAADAGVALIDTILGGTGQEMQIPVEGEVTATPSRQEEYEQLRIQLREISQGLTPLADVKALGMNLGGAAQSLPMTVAALVPYAGQALVVGQFRQEGIATTMQENPGMARKDAEMIANISAPIQAAAEVFTSKLLFGKLPMFEKFLNSPLLTSKGIMARLGTRVAVGTGTEMLEESLQKATPLIFQEAANALSEDVPGVDWNARFSEFKNMQLEVFTTALPLVLIGAGVGTMNDYSTGVLLAKDKDALVMAGYSREAALEIQAKVKEGDLRGAEIQMRQSAETATPEERQMAAQAYEMRSRLQSVATAALEADGQLASVRPTAGGKWQVINPDNTAPIEFDNFEAANAARWADAKARKLRVHSVYRDIISQADAALREGQENAFIFSPERMTADRAVETGLVSASAVDARKKQLAALDEGKLEDQTFRTAENEAKAEGDTDPVYTILGMNQIEYKDSVSRGVIRLFQGANFTDLIEEIAEVGFKRHFTNGGNRTTMLASLRQAEAAIQRAEVAQGMEPSLLFRTKDDSQIGDGDLIEAFSHLAKSYYINAVEEGQTSQKWRTKNKNLPRFLRTLRAALANTEIFKWLKVLGDKLGTIYQRAAMVQAVRKEGGLDADLERLVRQSVGLDTQDQFEAGVLKEAQDMAQEAGFSMAGSRAQPTESAPSFVMPDGAAIVGPATFSIRAYHGTPHKVDKFTTAKIGTGEGAQAYGWGLYFAQDKTVGETYRNNLSKPVSANLETWKKVAAALRADDLLGFDSASAAMAAIRASSKWRESFGMSPETIALVDQYLGEQGNLYTVELLPDEADFLDWDKPLSEQSEKVKAALRDVLGGRDFKTMTDKPGMDVLGTLKLRGNSDMQVSAILAAVGIPGIKYLDGNSRDGGSGTHNYVIFDESLVKILEENGQPVEGGMSGPSMSLSKDDQSLEQRLAAMFDPFQKNPEQRRKLGLQAKERVAKVAAEYADIVAMSSATRQKLGDLETKYSEELAAARADYIAESKALRDERDFELAGAKQQKETKANIEKIKADYAARIAARDKAWEREKGDLELRQANERGAIQRGLGKLDTESLRTAIRTLAAAISTMPAKVQRKILPGGINSMFRIKTDAGRIAEIERLVVIADVELEKFLKQEILEKIEQLLERYASKVSDSGQMESKLTVNTVEIVDFASNFSKLPVEPDPKDATKQSQQGVIAELEKIISDPESAEAMDTAIEQLGIAELFFDIQNKEASEVEAALQWLEKTVQKGRDLRKALNEARKAYLKERKDTALNDVLDGQLSSPTEAQNTTAIIESSLFTKVMSEVKGLVNSLLWTSAHQLEVVFGKDSAITKEFYGRLVTAANQSTDIKRDFEARRKEAMAVIFDTGSKVAQAGKVGKLQAAKKSGVVLEVGAKTKQETIPAEIVKRIMDGKADAKAYGLDAAQVAMLSEAWTDNEALKGNRKKQNLPYTVTVSRGRPVELTMSQGEGIQYLLWSRQQASRTQMERDGWTTESFNQLNKFLSSEAKQIAAFLIQEYQAAGKLVAPVFERLFNTPFPSIQNYSPIYRDVTNEDAMAPLDAQQMSSGIAGGFTKSRNKRANAPLKRVDAITAYMAHIEHLSHWVSFVEVLRDMKAVIASREVQNAITTKKGKEAAQLLKTRIKSIEMQGNQEAWTLHDLNAIGERLNTARAFKGLAWRISPIMKQASALFNPLLGDVPAWAFMRGFAKLAAGKLDLSGMIGSDIIQRRIEGGFSPEARIAQKRLSMTGSQALAVMGKGMIGMTLADAGLTGMGAAITFDYYRSQNLKQGMSPELAASEARRQLEITIAETAQPTDAINRALVESTANPWVKGLWLFASETRKMLAIELMAARRLVTGTSKNKAMDVQRILVAHILSTAVTQTMSGVFALLMGDDDDVEREWSEEQWAAALIAGPINGLFVIGRGIQMTINKALGLRVFQNTLPMDKVYEDIGKAGSNLDDLANGDPEEFRKELFRISAAFGAVAAITVGPGNPITALDVLGNALKDVDDALTRDD